MDDRQWHALVDNITLVQRNLYNNKIPVLILLEGCSGRVLGRVSGDLLEKFEPRGMKYHHFDSENRCGPKGNISFLANTPSKGQIAIYDRGWYSTIAESLEDAHCEEIDRMVFETNTFERYLVDNGVLLIKLFLFAEEDELEGLLDAFGERHKKKSILNDDHIDAEIYCGERMKDVIRRTDTDISKWNIIRIEDPETTSYNSIYAICQSMIESVKNPVFSPIHYQNPKCGNPRIYANLSQKAENYKDKMDEYYRKLKKLQGELAVSDKALVVVFEGWDAAGKGGSIKRLAHALNPRGYTAVPIGVPTDEDKDHTYLWRFCSHLPTDGRITIFDRSWYGRMLVEPIEMFCTHEEYLRSGREINGFERSMVNSGIILVKLWMEISKAEQLNRFNDRVINPMKNWKITDDDWRNREKWDIYSEYVDRMIETTNTPDAPWTVVESENKKFGRLKVLETVIRALEKNL